MYELIDTPAGLAAMLARVRHAPCVALDTEFVWERTYYPQLSLIQLALNETECYLLDVPALGDLTPLAEVLTNPGIVKILHDAIQDLAILMRVTGAAPLSVFDTKRAAGFVELTCTLSLAELLRRLALAELPKTETRTNWLQRPLTQKQLDYAGDDVRFLPAAREALLARIRERQLEEWVQDDLQALDDAELYRERDPREHFLRLKAAQHLPRRELGILRELVAWREGEARRRNRPRGYVALDGLLVNIARHKPRTLEAMKKIQGGHGHAIDRYGTRLLEILAEGLGLEKDQLPQAAARRLSSETLKRRSDPILQYIKSRSAERGIDSQLVGSRGQVVELLQAQAAHPPLPHLLLQGWRRALLGERIEELSACRTGKP